MAAVSLGLVFVSSCNDEASALGAATAGMTRARLHLFFVYYYYALGRVLIFFALFIVFAFVRVRFRCLVVFN